MKHFGVLAAAAILCARAAAPAMGRFDESIAQIERAWYLDPLSPLIQCNAGCMLLEARRYEAALERCRKTPEMDPGYGLANIHLGRCYMAMHRYEDAVAPLEKASCGFPMAMSALGVAYARLGWRDRAEVILRQLEDMSRQRYVGPFTLAPLYGALDGADRAVEWFGKALDARDGTAPLLGVDPAMDWLRADSRFAALVRRLGLPC